MLRILGLAAVALTLAVPAHADHMRHKKGHGHGHGHATHSHENVLKGGTITVSCFRGPWREVIIDRPNAVFVDSLVDVGYTYERAHAIATRICRDEELVGNPDAMREEMRRIYRSGT